MPVSPKCFQKIVYRRMSQTLHDRRVKATAGLSLPMILSV